ncbi:hypothetical protein L6452_43447 [Arctium lappa]|uniref:Uncharacterized protein n=1 Tax=Arctium lappa TaxID=4217 RepID=A0ACB8XDL3_ARCLA|nr:hypothetical protein L6452_43447 [Arctium lappa]
MDCSDLENVPPDLRDNFLENFKIVSAPIECVSDVQLESANEYIGSDLPKKVSGLKIKDRKSFKDFLSSSLGFNVSSPFSNSIKKDTPKRISKGKGTITGEKKIAATVDLVKSDLANKSDRSSVFVRFEEKMDVEAEISAKIPLIFYHWSPNFGRNSRLHSDKCRHVERLAVQIIELMKLKLMGLRVKNNEHVRRVVVLWGLKFERGKFCDSASYYGMLSAQIFIGEPQGSLVLAWSTMVPKWFLCLSSVVDLYLHWF